MNCPRTQSPLEEAEFDGAVVRRCGSCEGTWMTRAAFDAAAEREDEDIGWLAFELWKDADRFRGDLGDLGCPSCGRTMARLSYGDEDVTVDVCPDCEGVWLDKAELERTVRALRKELFRMNVGELLGAAFEEAAGIQKQGGSLAREWRHLARVGRLVELRVLSDHPSLRRLLMSVQGGGGFP